VFARLVHAQLHRFSSLILRRQVWGRAHRDLVLDLFVAFEPFASVFTDSTTTCSAVFHYVLLLVIARLDLIDANDDFTGTAHLETERTTDQKGYEDKKRR
jgi:hypothetical protein